MIRKKKPRTRRDMIAYLNDHFRYDTLNSWNRATSYARNVKIRWLKFPSREVRDRAYELLEVVGAFYGVRGLIDGFGREYNYDYQAWFNGRSGGYLVLGQGGSKPSGYKTICASCRQGNYQVDTKVCGRCRSTAMVPYFGTDVFTQPGLGLDMARDYSDWDIATLRGRVDLVMRFDRLCDECEEAFVRFCVNHTVEDEVVMVSRTRKVAVEICN